MLHFRCDKHNSVGQLQLRMIGVWSISAILLAGIMEWEFDYRGARVYPMVIIQYQEATTWQGITSWLAVRDQAAEPPSQDSLLLY
jgi:hypothetical protein